MAAATLADIARRTPFAVDELPGWSTRRRPGRFRPIGVLIHHTGTRTDAERPFPTRRVLLEGRPDLPGPLCQIAPDANGVLRLVAAGRANHAGWARQSGPNPAGDGNELYYGLELDYSGLEVPTDLQYAAAVAMAGELCKHHGWGADVVRGHRETSITGKWDPGRVNMDQFRRDVAAYIKEDDMALDPATAKLLRHIEDRTNLAHNYSKQAHLNGVWTKQKVAEILTKLGQPLEIDTRELAADLTPLLLDPLVEALGEGQRAAVEDALRDVLGSLNDS